MKEILDKIAKKAKFAKLAYYDGDIDALNQEVGEIQRLILDLIYGERSLFTFDENESIMKLDERIPDDQVKFREIGGETVPINKKTNQPVGGWKGNPDVKEEIAENKSVARKKARATQKENSSINDYERRRKRLEKRLEKNPPKSKDKTKEISNPQVVKEEEREYVDAGSDILMPENIHTIDNYDDIVNVAREVGASSYDKGREVAKKYVDLKYYLNHGYDHIRQVTEKSEQAANELGNILKENGYGDIDKRVLAASALMHDTGMDGDSTDYEGAGDTGQMLRSDHPLNSAINVLKNRESFEKIGINPDEVAMVVLAHSKSSSRIDDLTDLGQYQIAVNNIQSQVKAYNKVNGDNPIEFKTDIFQDEKMLKDIGAMAACIRLGDANRDNSAELISQTGGKLKYNPNKYDKNTVTLKEEQQSSDVTLDGEPVSNGLSKTFAVGENNFKKTYVEKGSDGKSFTEVIELEDGSKYPWSTAYCIVERVGELQTINGVNRTIRIDTGLKIGGKEWKKFAKALEGEVENAEYKRGRLFDRGILFDIN